MKEKKLIEDIRRLAKARFKEYALDWTYERSEGNYTDCFEDGYTCGESNFANYILELIEKGEE